MTLFKLGHVVGEDGADGSPGAKGDKGDKGDTGATGNGIQKIELKSTSGKTKTYRITYTNGSTFDFEVKDGEDGSSATVDIVTSWNSTLSDAKVPSEKLTKNNLDNKVDKVTGKGLSSNDFTNSYKSAIDGLSTVATTGDYDDLTDKPTIPSASTTTPSADTSSGSYGSGTNYARSNHTHPKSSLYAESSHTHTVSNITDFPSIPSSSSDLSDGSDLVKKSSTTGLIKNDGSIDTSTYLTSSALSNYVQKSNTSGLLKNDGTVDTTTYSTFSGSYNDLSNKPTIPSSLADLSDGSLVYSNNKVSYNTGELATLSDIPSLTNYVQKSSTSGLLKNDGTVDTTSYSTFSGSYSDLDNKPSIPSSSSDLSDGSDLVKKSSTTGLLKNDGSIMVSGTGSGNYAAGNHTHSGYVSGTKVTNWQSTPSDSNIPSEKLVSDTFAAIEDLIGDAITYINQ